MQISQMGFGQGGEKTKQVHQTRLLMGAPQVPNLPPMKLKTRVTLSYPTHKVLVKASKRSVVGMAFIPTSKVAGPLRASWSPPRTKTLWSTKVVPSTGTNVVT